MKRAQTPRRDRSVLNIVVGLLLVSAMIRLGGQVPPAQAEASQDRSEQGQAAVSAKAPDESTFLAALQTREAELNLQEATIDEKLAKLADAQAELDAQLVALTEAEAALRATIAAADSASEMDVTRLATVYENMKPKEAAALFAEMPPEFAAGFLGMMRPDLAAAIMTELTPETAYSFSVVLAGRNANAGRD